MDPDSFHVPPIVSNLTSPFYFIKCARLHTATVQLPPLTTLLLWMYVPFHEQ